MNANDTYADANGILRWKENDAVLPTECALELAPKGYDHAKHEAARKAEVDAFFAAYTAKPRVRSAEELSEIRANIGPDAIDILTGERIFARKGA